MDGARREGCTARGHRKHSAAMAPWGAHVFVAVAGATVVGIAATPLLVPALVGAAGFASGGITAGSWAAGLMSSYAGFVPAGSLCAVLQSVGAAGLAPATIAAAEGAAAALAAGSAAIATRLYKKEDPPPNTEEEDKEKKSDDGETKSEDGKDDKSSSDVDRRPVM